MIDNEAIQRTVVSRLKNNVGLTALLLPAGADEVREAQWQGRDFAFPNVRVEIGPQTPTIGPAPCDWSEVTFTVYCHSEQDSSLQCEQVASAVKDALDKKHFTGQDLISGQYFRFFYCHVTRLEGARRAIDNRIWRSAVVCQSALHII